MWNLFSDGQNTTTFGSLTGAGKGWRGPVHIEILIKGTCLKYMGVRSHVLLLMIKQPKTITKHTQNKTRTVF